MKDTAAAAEARYYELLRGQTAAERLTVAARLSRAVRELAEAAIRTEHPHAGELEKRWHLARRLYGEEVANRLFRKRNLP